MMKKFLSLFLLIATYMNAQVDTTEIDAILASENSNRTTIINVIVDANKQFGNSLNLDYIVLKDNHQNAVSGADIQTYTSDVYNNEMVIWIIRVDDQSKRRGYSAELTQIEMKNKAVCIFGTTKIPGNSPIIMAEVIGNAECSKESYTVKFLLRTKDGDVETFEFDPILRGNN